MQAEYLEFPETTLPRASRNRGSSGQGQTDRNGLCKWPFCKGMMESGVCATEKSVHARANCFTKSGDTTTVDLRCGVRSERDGGRMTGRTLDPGKERETRDGSSVSTGTVSVSQVPGLPHSDAWPVPRQSERGASLCDPTQPSLRPCQPQSDDPTWSTRRCIQTRLAPGLEPVRSVIHGGGR